MPLEFLPSKGGHKSIKMWINICMPQRTKLPRKWGGENKKIPRPQFERLGLGGKAPFKAFPAGAIEGTLRLMA
jgi:hypothetical protein